MARDNRIQEVEDEVINNPNVLKLTDSELRSALHWAVDREHLEMTSKLISLGADVNLSDRNRIQASCLDCEIAT